MTIKTAIQIAAPIIAIFLTACGSNDSTSAPENTTSQVLTGMLIDSAVEGVSFTTQTQTGTTNGAGEYQYLVAELVTFGIGELQFPTTLAAEIITPIEMAEGSSDEQATATNIARLLQSLDTDGDPSNGITIPPSAAGIAVPVNFDVSISDFETNADIINLIANSGSTNTILISAEAASAHLLTTLAPEPEGDSMFDGLWGASNGTDYALIDQAGNITFYDFDDGANCYTTRTGSLQQIENTLYQITTTDGVTQQVVIVRNGNTLSVLPLGTLTLITDVNTDDLTLCTV